MISHSDFIIIGGGILGVSIALELKRRYTDCSVHLIEKENSYGCHASGRNSGVLHAGIYYPSDSLKARFTRQGNIELHAFCARNKIPIRQCGKLIVTRNEAELKTLDLLAKRAKENNVPVETLNEDEVKCMEPLAQTVDRALFSPTTSSADPIALLHALVDEAKSAGVQFHLGISYKTFDGEKIHTNKDSFSAGYIINAAGLYADVIAKQFGFAQEHQILPFKGLYLYAHKPMLQTHIYPVPDLNYPFLGVHFTVSVDGKTKIGPTAIPAFWREQYKGFENFSLKEAWDIGIRSSKLFIASDFDFKGLAIKELRKYSKKHLVTQAQALVPTCQFGDFHQWGRAGIRAQLISNQSGKLVMDFLFEGNNKSFHILNAVSPGWTCALPFSRFLCDEIDKKIN